MKAINFFLFPLILCCILVSQETKAQCDPSTTKGIHVVQKGENLYRIAKAYGVTLEQIGAWNGLSASEVIPLCKVLYVQAPNVVNANAMPTSTAASAPVMHSSPSPSPVFVPAPVQSKTGAKPLEAYAARTDGTHVLQPGETIAGIAQLYGYSEERFRYMNTLSNNLELMPGSALRTTDCDCNPRIWLANTSMVHNTPEIKTTTQPTTYSTNPDPYTGQTSYPRGVDPYPPAQTGTVAFVDAETHLTGNNGESYNYSKTTTYPVTPGGGSTAPKPQSSSAPTTGAVSSATYMSMDERRMMDEINLVRSNPSAYVKYIEEYINYMRANGEMGNSISTANELISELRNTQPLSQLSPTPCIYNAAKKHGLDQKPFGDVNHRGSDGSMPWDRVVRECPSMQDGNENLVGGPSDIRRAVILLLVDEGIDSRGHRRTLLDPRWNYAACYYVGQVGAMPNNWVQNFGF